MGPDQSTINLIENLGRLNYNEYRPQIFYGSLAKPPVNSDVPIFPLYLGLQHRVDALPKITVLSHSIFMTHTLRRLEQNTNNKILLWIDCPEWLYPTQRHNFVQIVNAYRSNHSVVAGSDFYKELLIKLGVNVKYVVENFDSEQMESVFRAIQEEE